MTEENAKDATSLPSYTDGSVPRIARRAARWFSWIFGFAMFAAVIIAALHFSEEREFLHIAERAQMWWLVVAVVLQVGTYLAQGEIWRVVTRAAGITVPLSVAFKLRAAFILVQGARSSQKGCSARRGAPLRVGP
ncbi:hypothetical protein [Noviherbaspirillum sp.]|jgi:Mg2+-importing ATPase|uniref:hypothetical protein n=1 Tax=Noviherbaspirillum sp. TaxID=1926288 RepID=UPI0025FFB0A6|nr:hypothetical protein [Noviherbaspirillum sp.]